MANLIPRTPGLPRAISSAPSVTALAHYDAVLNTALFKILSEIAIRLNSAFVKDGSESSGTATIADDAATTIDLSTFTASAATILFTSADAAGLYGWVWARATATDAINVAHLASSATITGTTGAALDGNDGIDGQWTLSAEASLLYIENRTGASKTIKWLVLGA